MGGSRAYILKDTEEKWELGGSRGLKWNSSGFNSVIVTTSTELLSLGVLIWGASLLTQRCSSHTCLLYLVQFPRPCCLVSYFPVTDLDGQNLLIERLFDLTLSLLIIIFRVLEVTGTILGFVCCAYLFPGVLCCVSLCCDRWLSVLNGRLSGSCSGVFAVISLSTGAKYAGFCLLYFVPWNMDKTLVQIISHTSSYKTHSNSLQFVQHITLFQIKLDFQASRDNG